ncbi:hypothetical protein QP162_12715 [Sphingomonas aurantiaca]
MIQITVRYVITNTVAGKFVILLGVGKAILKILIPLRIASPRWSHRKRRL